MLPLNPTEAHASAAFTVKTPSQLPGISFDWFGTASIPLCIPCYLLHFVQTMTICGDWVQ